MNKRLNEAGMRSELSGSTFFQPTPPASPRPPGNAEPAPRPPIQPTVKASNHGFVPPRAHDTTTPASQADEGVIETIRKAVKQLGKEDATYRFTEAEKKALADVVYTYSVAGTKTSQNEVTRIGINYLLEDYRRNSAGSVLARVLERLNE